MTQTLNLQKAYKTDIIVVFYWIFMVNNEQKQSDNHMKTENTW